jgi:hypothetical protein
MRDLLTWQAMIGKAVHGRRTSRVYLEGRITFSAAMSRGGWGDGWSVGRWKV